MNLEDLKNFLEKGVVGIAWPELPLRERIVWRFLWATHWMGWHQTMPIEGEPEVVWCADCLRSYKKE